MQRLKTSVVVADVAAEEAIALLTLQEFASHDP